MLLEGRHLKHSDREKVGREGKLVPRVHSDNSMDIKKLTHILSPHSIEP